MIKQLLQTVQSALETLDGWRDKALFILIKKYWPRAVTPNQLTGFRLGIGVLLSLCLFVYQLDGKLLVILLFAVGILSDLLDGSIARCLNQKTAWGAIADPIADRVLIVPIAVYSLMRQHLWLLCWLIGLELINSLLSAYAQYGQTFIPPNIFGKTKMALQCIVFAAILIYWPYIPSIFVQILWISVIVMIISIYAKTFDVLALVKQRLQTPIQQES